MVLQYDGASGWNPRPREMGRRLEELEAVEVHEVGG
jgi:hypothetical protein